MRNDATHASGGGLSEARLLIGPKKNRVSSWVKGLLFFLMKMRIFGALIGTGYSWSGLWQRACQKKSALNCVPCRVRNCSSADIDNGSIDPYIKESESRSLVRKILLFSELLGSLSMLSPDVSFTFNRSLGFFRGCQHYVTLTTQFRRDEISYPCPIIYLLCSIQSTTSVTEGPWSETSLFSFPCTRNRLESKFGSREISYPVRNNNRQKPLQWKGSLQSARAVRRQIGLMRIA